MYTKVCSKMKESVSSAFYMGTLKMQGGFTKALCETSEERKRVAGEG